MIKPPNDPLPRSRGPGGAAAALVQAAQLLAGGRAAEAVALLQRSSLGQHGNASILRALGAACLDAGQPAQAIVALRSAAALGPDSADTHFGLGTAFERVGQPVASIEEYDRAARLLPRHSEALYRAGALLLTFGRTQDAVERFRRAAASGPKSSPGRLSAARIQLVEGRDRDAERTLRQMLAVYRGDPIALDLLGTLLAEAGRFAEARDCFGQAIDAAPLMAGSYYDLVRCRRVTTDDKDLRARLQAALSMPGLDDAQRVRVHLAAGKAADDLGDPAAAMRSFGAATALRSAARPFDAAVFDAELRRLAARFPPSLIAAAGRPGSSDRTPILIVGLPRSGTTLIEQIVSAHPDVAAGGELNFWNERGAASLAPGAAGTSRAFLAQAAADYLGVLRAISADAPRVTDKLPFNLVWAGLIHLACPGATIVHCRRSPIDTALSIHQTHFNPNLAMPTGGEALVGYVRSMHGLASYWRSVLPTDRFIEISYEELTATPEPVIRRLITACGLSWHSACLSPERNPRAVRTPSKWQARQPINRASVEKWRRYEPWLGALRDLL